MNGVLGGRIGGLTGFLWKPAFETSDVSDGGGAFGSGGGSSRPRRPHPPSAAARTRSTTAAFNGLRLRKRTKTISRHRERMLPWPQPCEAHRRRRQAETPGSNPAGCITIFRLESFKLSCEAPASPCRRLGVMFSADFHRSAETRNSKQHRSCCGKPNQIVAVATQGCLAPPSCPPSALRPSISCVSSWPSSTRGVSRPRHAGSTAGNRS